MKTYLEDLRESNEFLNLLLDNINTAVLIADEDLRIQQVNDFFLSLFGISGKGVAQDRFGNVAGCAFAVNENRNCGATSHCVTCLIRGSLMETLLRQIPVDKVSLDRVFYIEGVPTRKHLEFSTRYLSFQGSKMILVLIYDVTERETRKIELQQKQEQLTRDLEAAADIQKSLLPDFAPSIDFIGMAWKFKPSWRIGGDIFNIHFAGEYAVGLYMLDVCGHGVSAAMVSVAVSQFLYSKRFGTGIPSPEAVLNRLDKAFPFERFDTYFSIVYLTIDCRKGILSYSCAGHPPPVLLHLDGTLDVLAQHGPVIGLGGPSPFVLDRVRLRRDDRIILYTDGLTENSAPEGELFGKDRFFQTLVRNRERTVQELVDSVYDATMRFGEGSDPNDDISILALEYTGP
jgi:sigma-B regulation protein RsbU (phosphoserine phosphatase)